LRDAETERLRPGGPATTAGVRGITEFWEEDFPGLKG
jgi:hypothetical protein